ncbi:phosphatase and actin regulator 2 isoform X2 [Polypterus senegalus]|uniref:phosphatase and actin regulator 2 isoform X2 n=1 Tax=Polypterus senegalus TaxID=55291 RepID=UPI001964C2B2|nr:phosphatase and actin regulator 2 isoform X2 [Polypterus senegalus]
MIGGTGAHLRQKEMGQTSVSSSAQNASVDGLEKASLANTDVVLPGSQTPPLKRKGKLSSLGKIFKPWKWRKKKTSEKFQQTSAVLERKISMRQSREELIRRGVLKDISDQDGDVTVNSETSNGHTVPISIEPVMEEVQADIEKQKDLPAENKAPLPGETGEKPERIENRHLQKVHPARARDTTVKKSQMPLKTQSGASAANFKKEEPPVKKTSKTTAKQPPTAGSKQSSRNSNNTNVKQSHTKKAAASKTVAQSSSPSPSGSSTPKSKASSTNKTSSLGISKANKKPDKQLDNLKGRTANTPKTVPSASPGCDDTEVLKTKKEPKGAETPCIDLPGEHLASQQPSSSDLPDSNSILSFLEEAGESPETPILSENKTSEISDPGSNSIKDHIDQEQNKQVKTDGDEAIVPPTPEEDVTCCTKKENEECVSCKFQVLIPDTPDVSVIPDDENKENQISDSDSDGPILYRDEDEEEEDDEDESTSNSLASKIRRRDTLAIKLGNRPSKKELEEKNILPRTSEEERQEIRQQIGCKLVRRLSQRPTTEELEQRNILKQKNEEEEQEAKQEIKRRLSRKLSVRPTVAELVARRILRFNEYVEVTDAKDYDRRADKPWTRLTPADKAAIRKELNEFKSNEMEVHKDSVQFTRYHRP